MDCRKNRSIGFTLQIALVLLATTALTALTPSSARAADGEAGTFISPWLDMAVSARAGAMGGAFNSIAEGGFGHLDNPAGLIQLNKTSFSTSYRKMNFDRKISYASVTFPLREEAVLAFSWQYAGYGTVQKRRSTGHLTGGVIGQDEHQFSVVFGKRFSKRMAFGATVSYYHWQLDVIKSNSALFDIGALFFIDHYLHDRDDIGLSAINDIRVGITLRALGSTFPIGTDKYWETYRPGIYGGTLQAEIAKKLIVGVSGRALDDLLLISTDIEFHQAFGVWTHFGAEYEIAEQLAIRAGLNRGKLTAGTGFVFDIGQRELLLDYAFQAERVQEGAEHLFTLQVGF